MWWHWKKIPDDGCGKYPKHVEGSCNKTKILVLHFAGIVYVNME
jgi:hypothetical protein